METLARNAKQGRTHMLTHFWLWNKGANPQTFPKVLITITSRHPSHHTEPAAPRNFMQGSTEDAVEEYVALQLATGVSAAKRVIDAKHGPPKLDIDLGRESGGGEQKVRRRPAVPL